jgi:hypothetical protein
MHLTHQQTPRKKGFTLDIPEAKSRGHMPPVGFAMRPKTAYDRRKLAKEDKFLKNFGQE